MVKLVRSTVFFFSTDLFAPKPGWEVFLCNIYIYIYIYCSYVFILWKQDAKVVVKWFRRYCLEWRFPCFIRKNPLGDLLEQEGRVVMSWACRSQAKKASGLRGYGGRADGYRGETWAVRSTMFPSPAFCAAIACMYFGRYVTPLDPCKKSNDLSFCARDVKGRKLNVACFIQSSAHSSQVVLICRKDHFIHLTMMHFKIHQCRSEVLSKQTGS